jgi:hypothetical protein
MWVMQISCCAGHHGLNEFSVWAWTGILRELTFIDDGEQETGAGIGGVVPEDAVTGGHPGQAWTAAR